MFAEASFEMTAGAFTKASDADKRLMVQFNFHPHLDQAASNEAGRPIYKDKVYIMIIVPGDKDSIVHRPANEMDFRRFPEQYQHFKNKDTEAIVGTPLSLVPWLTSSQIKELDYFNIKTVEHLANVNDGLGTKFHGLQTLKKRAQDFMAAATNAAPLTEMRTQLEQRDSQIEALQKQLGELAARVEKSEKEKK